MDFALEETPEWRGEDSYQTSEMLQEIYNHQVWYMDTPLYLRKEILKIFVSKNATDWVFSSNHLELEGTLDGKKTEEICKRFFSNQKKKEFCTETLNEQEEVTMKTLEALDKMYEYRVDMKKFDEKYPQERYKDHDFLFLTEDMVKDIHKIVLPRNKKNSVPPGEYRIYPAYPSGSPDQFYCDPRDIRLKMETLIDRYNDHVCNLPKSFLHNKMKFDVTKIRKIYNLAAWILFHFVNIHPFGDGNGRVCRLLANGVLFDECPFPVFLRGSYSLKKARNIYIDSIVQCRRSDNQNPSLLAAFIIESCLEQWRSFKMMYKERVSGKKFDFRGIPTLNDLQEVYSYSYFSDLSTEKGEEILRELKAKAKNNDENYMEVPFSFDDGINFNISVRLAAPILVKGIRGNR